MPTYDYACKRCGHTFEAFQSLSEKLLKKCPACGKQGLERLFGTGIGVVFKGSGFYETDYKRAGRGAGKEATSSSADAGKGSDKGKADGAQGAGGKADKGGKADGSTSGGAKPGTSDSSKKS